MEFGDRTLYRHMTIIESTGDCPHPEFVLGSEAPDRRTTFHWLDDDLERHTEVEPCRALAVVEMPDWMTADEARAWVQARPDRLEEWFDAEWHRHQDLLDQHFGGTAWFDAKSIPVDE